MNRDDMLTALLGPPDLLADGDQLVLWDIRDEQRRPVVRTGTIAGALAAARHILVETEEGHAVAAGEHTVGYLCGAACPDGSARACGKQ